MNTLTVKNLIFSVAVLILTFAEPSIVMAQNWEDSVVRIFVSKREVDESSPWQHEEIRQNIFHGIVVDGGSVLTTAYAVQNAVEMEMLRFGESRKFPLTVRFIDYEINLALLSPEDPAGVTGLIPVKITDEIAMDLPVTVMKARDNNQLISIGATMQEVGIYTSVTSEYSFATYLAKTQQSALGWSEPIIRNGSVVAVGSGQDSQYLHAIPGAIVNHFLTDVQSGSYRGFPSIGIELDRLTSPEMRKMLGADGIKHGVRIANVEIGTEFSNLLQKNDVLLAVDGIKINENGFYVHPMWGTVHLKYLLNRKFVGERIKLEVLRLGEKKVIEAALSRFNSNATRIVAYREKGEEQHVIFGGIVLRELTVPFLKQWGKEWRSSAPYQMLYEFNHANDVVNDPDNNRVVIISRILADEFNRGYAAVKNAIVREINGIPVKSLTDVRKAFSLPVARGGRQFARIVMAYEDGEIVLSYDGLAEAHKRIGSTYNIRNVESFWR